MTLLDCLIVFGYFVRTWVTFQWARIIFVHCWGVETRYNLRVSWPYHEYDSSDLSAIRQNHSQFHLVAPFMLCSCISGEKNRCGHMQEMKGGGGQNSNFSSKTLQ